MARVNRIKSATSAFYHVMSRVVNKEFLMKEDESKRHFMDLLWRVAEFSGVLVAGFCVMDNHFHLLVQIDPSLNAELGEDVILYRIGVLMGARQSEAVRTRWASLRANGRQDEYEADLECYRKRMGDVSQFMKTLKQRYTTWHNAHYSRVGTLWTGRFKSVLIENEEHLATVRRYVESNPVRAGMVERSVDYGWSSAGYGTHGNARDLAKFSRVRYVWSSAEYCGDAFDDRIWAFCNGILIGSLGYVRRMVETFEDNFKGVSPKPKCFPGLACFASHGFGSTPKADRLCAS